MTSLEQIEIIFHGGPQDGGRLCLQFPQGRLLTGDTYMVRGKKCLHLYRLRRVPRDAKTDPLVVEATFQESRGVQ